MGLLDQFGDLSGYQDLVSRIKNNHETIETVQGLGLPRAARLPVLAKLQQDLGKHVLLISNRADRALALFDELQFWAESSTVRYFPEPNPLFYEKSGWGQGTRRDRLSVLTLLAQSLLPGANLSVEPLILVAPIRAIMTKTLPRRDFLKHTQVLLRGQQVLPDSLTRAWVDTGYAYANIVVEPGQFSKRGGILDVWPPGEGQPVRIEFFGDEIDTMRVFAPATQRTVAQIQSLTITPAREILPAAASRLGVEFNELDEFHLPLANPFAGSVLDFLPDNALVALDGREFLSAAVADIEEEAQSRREDAIEAGELDPSFPPPFFSWSEIEDRVGKRPVIELGYANAPEAPPLAAAFEPGPRFAGKLRDFNQFLYELDAHQEPWMIVSRQSPRLKNLWMEGKDPSFTISDAQADQRFIDGTLAGGWCLHSRIKIAFIY
jgi:transcription-repair coupling factor (superfamily II helicase)